MPTRDPDPLLDKTVRRSCIAVAKLGALVNRKRIAWWLVRVVIAAVIPANAALSQSIWYVDASATGASSGVSWQDAFINPQQALSVASAGDSIWVAGGVYKPDGATLDKTLSFRVPSGVGLHGGFAGHESFLSQRNIAANPTILSGDLLGDDQPPNGHLTDNSHQVVRVLAGSQPSAISGLTISSGYFSLPVDEAAGLHCEAGATVHVDQCLVRYNSGASFGPGGACIAGDPLSTALISNTDFIQNRSIFQFGGAVAVYQEASLKCINCRFFGNRGMGGAIYTSSNSDVTVANCLFSGNVGTAGDGSAIMAIGALSVASCTFSRNHMKPHTSNLGGAIAAFGGDVSIVNCILTENTAFGDTAAQIAVLPGVHVTASYCCIFWQEDPIIGEHHIFSDPLLLNPLGVDGIVGTEDDDLRLSPMSPCIDAGDATQVPQDLFDFDADGITLEPLAVDLALAPRLVDRPNVANTGVGAVPIDMGAYEVSNWSYLGYGLEGTNGVPWLEGGGDWFPGEQLSVKITNVRPSTLGAMVLGSTVQATPFKGGTLVPLPEMAMIYRTTVLGEISLSDTLPLFAAPGLVALQFWIIDPNAPLGVSATAAYAGTVEE